MSAVFRTPICDRFRIDYPIFGFAHSVEVTAAITNAGGLGVYGATHDTPEEIAARMAKIRSRVGGRPFGVDLVLPRGMPETDDRESIEDKIPSGHTRFVDELARKYDVPPPSRPGMRSRFVRSEETAHA